MRPSICHIRQHVRSRIQVVISVGVLLFSLALSPASIAQEEPHLLIERSVQSLLDEFVANRTVYEEDRAKLFELVDRVASPLFDFHRISKLILASNWKQASEQQRNEFAKRFKELLIRTYAIALFQYTGNEAMTFIGSDISERNGRKVGEVKSEVTIGSAPAIAVDYKLLLDDNGDWKIYNLKINGLNMILNFRNTYGASVDQLGIDGVIESMKNAAQ